ncbi:MAG: hypothetical protein GF308_16085 [Candidatus Heimdallarchaeota archaeon]|nr:hypothetical protein [Candidatus Heimdallarchaeota archaeon]
MVKEMSAWSFSNPLDERVGNSPINSPRSPLEEPAQSDELSRSSADIVVPKKGYSSFSFFLSLTFFFFSTSFYSPTKNVGW